MAGSVAGWAAVSAACSGRTQPSQATAPQVTITYLTDWNGGTRAEWIKAAPPKFSEEFSRIQVQVEVAASSSSEFADSVVARASAGTLPDTILSLGDVPQRLVRGGAMKDIAPVLKSLKVAMQDVVYVPSTIQVDGKQYGMPFQFNLWCLVVNKTLFKQNGAALPTATTTYPQLVTELQKIARPAEGIYGIETQKAAWVWFPYVWAWGGEPISRDGKKTTLDQPAAVEGLQFYVDMMTRLGVATPLDASGAGVKGVSFAAGNLAIANANAPGAGFDKSIEGRFEWDVIWNPLGPKTSTRGVFVTDKPNMVTAAAAQRGRFEQAVQFAVWTAGKTAQQLVLDIGTNSWPVSRAVLASAKYQAGPPAGAKILLDMAPAFKDPLIGLGYLEWRDQAITPAMVPAFANQKSVQDAAKDATRMGDLVLGRYAG
jgi:ABC-type glycerol-3-phosphate transport system substrate-binding protein